MTVSLMETDKKNYRKVKKHIICNFSSVLIKFLFLAQVRSALKLLDLLEELESVFDEGPLLLCDVKPEHFGVSEHGRAKVLDSDTVAFKDVLGGLESCSCRSCCFFCLRKRRWKSFSMKNSDLSRRKTPRFVKNVCKDAPNIAIFF